MRFFFFQAEDGIRDLYVTGVQTCALPIFVEPVLLGRIVDALSGTLPAGLVAAARTLAPLVGAWVGFGLFIIIASTLVAWFADRLAHRRRNMVLADYFEHVLQLPLAYHS